MENNPENNEMIEFFKAFANSERLRILGLLSGDGTTPAQIAAALEMDLDQVARHLENLQATGVVRREGETYRLVPEALTEKSRRVLSGERARTSPQDFEGPEYDRKILSNYLLPDGRLKMIPNQLKKQLVVLRHLAQNFTPGERYTEKQVNEILRQFHEDTAALRRYMVDNHILSRAKGIYWREEGAEA